MKLRAEYVEFITVTDIEEDMENDEYYRLICFGEADNGSHEIRLSSCVKEDPKLMRVVDYKLVPIEKE